MAGYLTDIAEQLEQLYKPVDLGFKPTPKQQLFYDAADQAFETLYGGAAGGGKTISVAHYAADYCLTHPGAHVGIVRKVLGYLKTTHLLILRPLLHDLASYNGSENIWTFPNGSILRFISLPHTGTEQDYKSVEFDLLCFDEVTELTFEQYTYMLTRLRSSKGHRAHAVAASNPEGVGFRWVKDRFVSPPKVERPTPGEIWYPALPSGEPGPGRVFIPATVRDNPHLLEANPEYLKQLEALPDERKRRALLEGDWDAMDSVPGALFDLQNIGDNRVTELPDLVRTVVAIDPAVSFTETSDEFGIVVCARGADKQIYVIADYSGRFNSPEAAMKAVIAAKEKHDAGTIIYEKNQGGEFIKSALQQAGGRGTRLLGVTARKGKALRAEPVSIAYMENKVHHLNELPELETQLTTWAPEHPTSPDRLDALVYGVQYLLKPPPVNIPIRQMW